MRSFLGSETIRTVNRFVTPRDERNFRFFTARGTSDFGHLTITSHLRFTISTARRTSLRSIVKTFLSVKLLFGSRPDELAIAVPTGQRLICKIGHLVIFTSLRS